MKRQLHAGVAIGLVFVASIILAADKIRISGGGITPLHAIIWVANQEGLFKKYGLEAEYLTMNSGTLGAQTLPSNESQFLFSTGALAITANTLGADLAMITGAFNLFAFKIVGRPEIKSVQDLGGRKSPSASSAPRPILQFRQAWINSV